MGTRGPRSSADLAVATSADVIAIERALPPADLTDEQVDVWRIIVNRMPADWFPAETHPLLVQYCRHTIRARRLAQLLDNMEKSQEVDIKEYRDLLRSEEEQSRALASLATKLRISQQTRFDKSRKTPLVGDKLWDFGK